MLSIDNASINRTGLILTFIAGFLLAPELIGFDRIKRAEAVLEGYLKYILFILDQIKEQLWDQEIGRLISHNKRFKALKSFVMIAIILIYFGIFFFTSRSFYSSLFHIIPIIKNCKGTDQCFYSIKLFIETNTWVWLPAILFILFCQIIILILFIRKIRSRLDTYKNMNEIIKNFADIIFVLIILIAILLLGTVFTVVVPVFLVLFFGIYFLFSLIRKRLEGDDQLKSILVSIGIFLFILGNLLQLIGTVE